MQFLLPLSFLALSALAQNSPKSPTAAPAPVASGSSIAIITPTGSSSYFEADQMVVAWNVLGNAPDKTFLGSQITFEIADASGGALKISPIGVTLNGTATIADLQLRTVVPGNIPPGPAYCVRGAIKGATSFQYFFSPIFPINQAVGAPALGGGAAVVGRPVTGGGAAR
ncbi:hypothetical protein HDU98_011181 [Podochytrium sp. JEL0797]|nr:hypothetical protein HDU98_011181 [Podochytrium sp. JEL0797]